MGKIPESAVLYIHGWNGSPNGGTGSAVRNFFEAKGEHFIAEHFDLADFEATIKKITAIIENENVHEIVGHSFGGFYALSVQNEDIFTVVINPCMKPSVIIPKLGEVPSGFAEKFSAIEKEKFGGYVSGLVHQCTFGIFGKDDELFSFKDDFDKAFGSSVAKIKNSVFVDGTHHLEEAALLEGLSHSEKYREALSYGSL